MQYAGAAIGGLILTILGTAWVWAWVSGFGHGSAGMGAAIITGTLLVLSLLALMRNREMFVAMGPALQAWMRRFGVINGVAWGAFALLAVVLAASHHPGLIEITAIVTIGIHCFPLASLPGLPLLFYTGLSLLLMAVYSVWDVAGTAEIDSLLAGVVLWMSALAALGAALRPRDGFAR